MHLSSPVVLFDPSDHESRVQIDFMDKVLATRMSSLHRRICHCPCRRTAIGESNGYSGGSDLYPVSYSGYAAYEKLPGGWLRIVPCENEHRRRADETILWVRFLT